MEETKYFVRARGKITGPFDIETLSKLVRRGMLTGVDEISQDRRSWSRAAEYQDLFPVSQRVTNAGRARREAQAAEVQTDVGEPPVQNMVAAPAEEEVLYCYQQRGVTVGPVPVGVLKSLAANGTLRAHDLVWPDGERTAVRAGQLTFLMSIFHGTEAGEDETVESDTWRSAEPDRNSLSRMTRQLNTTNIVVIVTGILVGALVLLSVHLPWLARGDRVVGWWSVFEAARQAPTAENGAGWLLACVIILSLSAIALVILLPLLRAYPRIIVCLALGGLGAIFYIMLLFASPSASAVLVLFASLYITPASASGIAAVCRARGRVNGGEAGKTFLGVMSGIAALSALLIALSTLPHWVNGGKFVGLFLGFAVFILAQLVIVAAGIMGFVSLKPVFSPFLNTATALCARIGSLLVMAAFLIMVLDFSGLASLAAAFDHSRDSFFEAPVELKVWMTLFFIRLLVVGLFYPVVLMLGLEELADQLVIAPVVRRAARGIPD